MTKLFKVAVLFSVLAVSLFYSRLFAAQKFKQMPPAPIPSLILNAKKVFIANGGGDESLFDWPQYTGGPDRLYNEFYADMKTWGRYEIVGDPNEADLVFEISLILVQPRPSTPMGDQNPPYDSLFHLTLRDAKSHQTLWGMTEHAQAAILQGNRDKNFEQALGGIVAELRRIGGQASTAAPPPGK